MILQSPLKGSQLLADSERRYPYDLQVKFLGTLFTINLKETNKSVMTDGVFDQVILDGKGN